MRRLPTLLASALVAAATCEVRPTRACGGTFRAGAAAQPVEQRGANALFAVHDGRVEAHLQLRYAGEPSTLGWVIPVPRPPVVRIGSQALFDALLAQSEPTFDGDGPREQDECAYDGHGGCSGPSGYAPAPALELPQERPREPSVDRQRVGELDVAVLTGGGVGPVTSWLATSGLHVDAEVLPTLQAYVDEGYSFVAVKLTAGAGLDETHPIVVEYDGATPSLPLRLAASSAREDAWFRALFLGTGRWVSDSYAHVVPNDAAFDWARTGAGYPDVIARALDAPGADGRAFVTEYAGLPSLDDEARATISSPRWDPAPFVSAPATQVVALLNTQGLMRCWREDACVADHPLVFRLLRRWLPAPQGISEARYYAESAWRAKGAVFQGAGFAAELDSHVLEPGKRALSLLDRHPRLTRLATAISPAEMTFDPTFVERVELRDVPAARSAGQHGTCDGRAGLVLPSGREVVGPPSAGWPARHGPFDERVERYSGVGGPVVVVDRGDEIDAAVDAYNAASAWPPPTRLDIREGSTSGCAAAPARRDRLGLAGLVAAGALLALRRRRGA